MDRSDNVYYPEVRLQTLKANKKLLEVGLVRPEDEILTFGNVSVKDTKSGSFFGIKPSGILYSHMNEDDIVLLNIDGEKVWGNRNPSTDTPTHAFLYKSWNQIGSVVHTHSPFATAFAQASYPIKCLGTTHADYFKGEVPIIPRLKPNMLEADYELNTGKAIVEYFQKNNLSPLEIPGCLVESHGIFTWGINVDDALKNAKALEFIAELAYRTHSLNPIKQEIPENLRLKHFTRKHGQNSYYGQKQ